MLHTAGLPSLDVGLAPTWMSFGVSSSSLDALWEHSTSSCSRLTSVLFDLLLLAGRSPAATQKYYYRLLRLFDLTCSASLAFQPGPWRNFSPAVPHRSPPSSILFFLFHLPSFFLSFFLIMSGPQQHRFAIFKLYYSNNYWKYWRSIVPEFSFFPARSKVQIWEIIEIIIIIKDY